MNSNKNILILGAGISGLSTGILLLKKSYKATIWAKDLPPHTTSDLAAAIWYPYLSYPKDKVIAWSRFTLRYLKTHVMNDPESSCKMQMFTEIFDKKVGEPWWANAVESYRRPTHEELPKGYIDGYQIQAALMDTSIYMNWLLKQYQQLGGKIEEKAIKDINETFVVSNIVINCTGLGSRELFQDELIYPVRGQVVVVKSNDFDQVLADPEGHNSLAYIIPRFNDIVLGGTSQPNNWNLAVDPKDTKDILQKAKALSPLFDKVEIIDVKVGLRPARPEIRLETEQFGDNYVIHNYGHGGSGFTLSWGCAEDVVKLVEKL